MPQKITDRVNFQFIRYANCWEDADILLQALDVPSNARLLSIASAGDNSFSLLVKNPELVVAVDINEVQLFLVELKKSGIKNLRHDEFLEFMGFIPSKIRRSLFNKLQHDLSPEAYRYWLSHFRFIEKGVIHQGKFEQYFHFFCSKVLPFIHPKRRIKELLRPKSQQEQEDFYTKKWNTWRWRLLFSIFFSKTVMGRWGRDPEFLKEVNIKVCDYVYLKAQNELMRASSAENYILRYNLTASFGNLLPHYLKAENYEHIQRNIDKLTVFKGFAEEAVAQFGPIDGMNLSNIFEYLNPASFSEVASKLVQGLNRGGKLAYWNLMVPRRISALFPERIGYNAAISETLHQCDKGFFYAEFIVEECI